nr:MAG TPA: hypothetical protein [Caudoviricetes sp.]DAG64860.1 MAG TPA: hypothetical protein [Caudoviricetes sp.]DAH23900.1 MAG TPA: hypothetical protein [Bacteriophage sp.]DAH44979.1 MAG TPA: hypothetical protein [Caudoviricetes sp.]
MEPIYSVLSILKLIFMHESLFIYNPIFASCCRIIFKFESIAK